jgi:hypothetical protein
MQGNGLLEMYREILRAAKVPDRMIDEAEGLKIIDFREGSTAYFYIVESSAGASSFHGLSIWLNDGDFRCSCQLSVMKKKVCAHVASALIYLSKRFGNEWLKQIIKQNMFGIIDDPSKSLDRPRIKPSNLQP